MKVIDWEKSERGPQRRRTASGKPLHCCCICGKVEPWNSNWSWYGSVRDEDEERPMAKFCSLACADKGGRGKTVTDKMKRDAKDKEWREPTSVWREATDREKYDAAKDRQRRTNK